MRLTMDSIKDAERSPTTESEIAPSSVNTDPTQPRRSQRELSDYFSIAGAIGFGGGILITVAFILIALLVVIWDVKGEEIKVVLKEMNRNELVIYFVSWGVLLMISVMARRQIREILENTENNRLRRRADQIAIVIGLVLIVFLFKQSFLEQLFGGASTTLWIKAILFGGGFASGWVVWYLKQLDRYGEFFNILIMTVVIGFCWYARLTGPAEIQLTAAAVMLASLFRIAKDLMDASAKGRNSL
jgi:hypothetical protein